MVEWKTNTSKLTLFLPILLLILIIHSNTISTNYVAIAKKSSLKQLPSDATDFPNHDASVLQIHTFKSVQDSVGQYHIRGEVVNLSNRTLLYPKVSAILFDKNDSPVGSAKPWFVSGLKLIPNGSGTFDLVIGQYELSAKPASYRLSFTYTIK